VQQVFCMSFSSYFMWLMFFCPGLLWRGGSEPGVAMARVRIRLGGLGLTQFWPGVGGLLFPQMRVHSLSGFDA
jgi:hypothetical protein